MSVALTALWEFSHFARLSGRADITIGSRILGNPRWDPGHPERGVVLSQSESSSLGILSLSIQYAGAARVNPAAGTECGSTRRWVGQGGKFQDI